jgi:hypothetical protein
MDNGRAGQDDAEQSAQQHEERARELRIPRTPDLRQHLPARDYAVLVALFNGAMAATLLARKRSGGPLLERVDLKDLLLYAIATQKLSRVMTKGKVTTALRAPFTAVEGKGGAGELEERPRGRGLRRAIGELLTCPFCLGTWIASGFIYGAIFSPSVARTVGSIFAVSGVADFLNQAYVKAQEMNDQI